MRSLSNMELQIISGGNGEVKKIPDVCEKVPGWRGQVCDLAVSILTSEIFMKGVELVVEAAVVIGETAARQTPTTPGQRSGRE